MTFTGNILPGLQVVEVIQQCRLKECVCEAVCGGVCEGVID